jgi:hypothetical protein
MSVQTGSLLYCTPRDDVGPYTHAEVGYPTFCPTFFADYADDDESPTTTIYPYVPIYLIVQEINDRGGADL